MNAFSSISSISEIIIKTAAPGTACVVQWQTTAAIVPSILTLICMQDCMQENKQHLVADYTLLTCMAFMGKKRGICTVVEMLTTLGPAD